MRNIICTFVPMKWSKNNALQYHDAFGAEKSADVLWEMLCKQFPSMQKKTSAYEENALETRAKNGLSKKTKKGKNRAKNVV